MKNAQTRTCHSEGCTRPQHTRWLCPAHYQAWRQYRKHPIQHRAIAHPHDKVPPPTTCSVSDCQGWRSARGLCTRHYLRVWRRERREKRGIVSPQPGRPRTSPHPCQEPACSRMAQVKGRCIPHYTRYTRRTRMRVRHALMAHTLRTVVLPALTEQMGGGTPAERTAKQSLIRWITKRVERLDQLIGQRGDSHD